jgi:hypothetical protein
MQTQTAERSPAKDTAGALRIVGCLGAAAFVIAAAWFGLATRGVTVARAPEAGPDATPLQVMRGYYRWQVTTLPQERLYTSIAIAGFLCLAVAAVYLRDLLGRDRAPSGIGALLVGAGAVAWISGAVLELGGHRAVGLMATHANPIQATNSIAFTIDTIGDAFALAAFVLIGAGMLAFAGAALQQRPGHRAWAGYTIVIALAMLVTAGAYAAGVGGLSDLMLFADGVVLVPLWLIWTGRAGGFQPERASARPGAVARARASS